MDETLEVKPGMDEKGRQGEVETLEKDKPDVLARISSQDEVEELVVGVLDRRTEYGWLVTSWMAMFLCGMCPLSTS